MLRPNVSPLPEGALRLRAATRRRQAEVLVGAGRGLPAARRPGQEPKLDQVGLVDVLDRVGLLRDRGGNRLEADGAALKLLDDGPQDLVVNLVEAEGVDVQPG